MRVGVVHPGEMGAALATCLPGDVFWASHGRSSETTARAQKAGIVDLGEQESLVSAVEAIISVCPPAVAEDVADQLRQLGFEGLYVDVNAVAPSTAHRIGQRFARFVDGGIIGSPPSSGATSQHLGTRLYLSGEEASAVATLFADSHLDSRVIGSEPGRASALKMSYAAWTKGTSALLLSVAALATSEEVIEELMDEWEMSLPDLEARLEQVSARVGMKAWRFAGEMAEIARAFAEAGLPNGFHLAAADLYARLSHLKDQPPGQPGDVLTMLLDGHSDR